ncbi:hypothetical protein L1887_28115 [Cichorium endivia]|nr:hypothetical protein L1887_28115 [Cichorium endivia]
MTRHYSRTTHAAPQRAPFIRSFSYTFRAHFIPAIEMSFRLDHPFLQFPDGPETSIECMQRRDALTGRRVLEATIIYRDILRDAGLWAEIEPFLHRTRAVGEASFTCRGWDRLMANQDDTVHTELLLEFLSTVRYATSSSEARSRLVRFRLGGVPRECSFREFGKRTDSYTEADLQHQHFTQFISACTKGQPTREANFTIWATLSNVHFEAGSSRESQLRNPLHRLMHRIVTTSINQREGGEKVSGDDMTYLWVLLDPTRFLHLPYAFAVSLSTRATGASLTTPSNIKYFSRC